VDGLTSAPRRRHVCLIPEIEYDVERVVEHE
jgi:hypothetical protein